MKKEERKKTTKSDFFDSLSLKYFCELL